MSIQESENVQEYTEQLTCPITLQLLSDPHILICGHTFSRRPLIKILDYHKRCPICGASCNATEIRPNYIVKNLVQAHKRKVAKLKIKARRKKRNMETMMKIYREQMSLKKDEEKATNSIAMLDQRYSRRSRPLLRSSSKKQRTQQEIVIDLIPNESQRIKLFSVADSILKLTCSQFGKIMENKEGH